MSIITDAWENARLEYQKRYVSYVKKYLGQTGNEEVLGHLLECSYVLIQIFGLTAKQVEELEKHDFCGLTQADMDND